MRLSKTSRLLPQTLAMAGLLFGGSAVAAPIVMEGDFVRTAVGDNGTLGAGGSADPGIMHDPTGSRSWGPEDYLTPGTPLGMVRGKIHPDRHCWQQQLRLPQPDLDTERPDRSLGRQLRQPGGLGRPVRQLVHHQP